MRQAAEHVLVGLALDATRAQAVAGPAGSLAHALALDGTSAELPMAVSLEGRVPAVGLAGVALCRKSPHLACLDFLPHLGDTRVWSAGRHRLGADQALALVLEQIGYACAGASGLVLVTPAYLGPEQIALARALAGQAGVRRRRPLPPVLGSLTTPLATALAAYADHGWSGRAFVLDADDHALTWAAVDVGHGQAQAGVVKCFPHLGLRAWRSRLVDAVADRCVRQSRRDPRESATAEQSLYEQLDAALDACRQGRPAELFIHMTGWFQNLVLRPDELSGFCSPLARQAVDALRPLLTVADADGPPGAVLVTASAGRLPGVVALLQENLGDLAVVEEEEPVAGDDFGITLFDESDVPQSEVSVLSPDAPARAAYELAVRLLRGDLAPGHIQVAPLPPPLPVHAGPGRLHFRGQEYLLHGPTFALGRNSACDLVFDPDLYPTVAPRHCEIHWEHRVFVLLDRSQHGTLVNDRPAAQPVTLHPGDTIRLGADGPLLRFLGQGIDQRKLMTTA